MACSCWLSFPWRIARSVLTGVGQALLGPPWGPHGPGPCGPPQGPGGGLFWAPLGPYGRGLCGRQLALAGRALLAPLGPCGPGPCGPPWALVSRALVGPLGPLWAPPGPLTQHSAKHPGNSPYIFPFDHADEKMPYVYIYIYMNRLGPAHSPPYFRSIFKRNGVCMPP